MRAGFRAGLADIGTQAAKRVLELALLGDEVGGRLTDDHAIHHQAKMLGLEMLPARLQAVGHRHRVTGGVAPKAGFDTGARFLAELVHAKRAPFRCRRESIAPSPFPLHGSKEEMREAM
jgi:hypothetical protein